ncbi:MAG: low molecular weight phosphotyrosine protein phosphatase [Bacteroidales bacterium]|nr:low molecular weight phosphotyrosine protein phosphatase [Bacteroidales bacterium]
MKRILFVCHGNICRSPMAEFMLKRMVRQAGMEGNYEIASAATHDEEIGNPVYPMARQELAKHGIGCPGHAARQLTPDDYSRYDLIVGMDEANMNDMHKLFGGDPDGKLHLMMDYVGKHRDVADPWFTRNFTATWNDLQASLTALFNQLTANG